MMQDIDLSFSLKYRLHSKPEWVKDSGVGYVNITGLNFSMNLIPYSKNGKLQLDFTEVDIEITNYSTQINGTADFSKTLDYLLSNFKNFFKSELGNGVAFAITDAF